MVDEVITIPELQETLTATGTDLAVVRQSGLDKKVTLSTMKNYFITPATLSAAGVVQLNNTVNSTSTTQAATPNSVRITYEFAGTALQTAQTALNGLSGKANTSHTHNAADINAGVISTERLPIGNLNAFGIARHTSSLANPVGDSANGYVPSLPLVNSIASTVASHTNTFANYAASGTYNRWDGGSTNLNPALGLLSLGAAPLASPIFTGLPIINSGVLQVGSTAGMNVKFDYLGRISINGSSYIPLVTSAATPTSVGYSFLTTTNPNAVTFPRVNADNTVTYRDANGLRSDLSISNSNESTIGLTSEATQEEVNAGSSVTKYVAPHKLKSGSGRFGNSVTGGYNYPSFMDSMQERWGVVSVGGNSTITVPNLHTTATLSVIVSLGFESGGDYQPPKAIPSANGIRISNSDSNSIQVRYFTKGY